MTRYLDRSRTLDFLDCPRKRFWGYEYNGRGLSLRKLRMPLATGGWTHKGLEVLMKEHARIRAGQESEETRLDARELATAAEQMIEGAVSVAIDGYREELESRGLTMEGLEENPGSEFLYKEQLSLVEAFVRLAGLRVIPWLAEKWTWGEGNVEVELTPIEMFEGHLWQSRPDGLLTPKGEVLVPGRTILSWKTTSAFGPWKEAEARIDLQGVSDSWALEEVTGETTAGVQMVYLVKGKREKYAKLGHKIQKSPMVTGYKKLDGAGVEYAWSYEWEEYGSNRRLGKGWERFFVWREMGVKEWVEMLAKGEVQSEAGECLDKQWVAASPVYRHREQLARFKRQTVGIESRVTGVMDDVEPSWIGEEWLDFNFPQNTSNCQKFGAEHKCAFFEICHGSAGPTDEEFVARVGNHEEERKWLEG